MDIDTIIGDQNTERLLQSAYKPDPVPAEFAACLQEKLLEAAQTTAAQRVPSPSAVTSSKRGRRWRVSALAAGALAACVLIGIAFSTLVRTPPNDRDKQNKDDIDLPHAQLADWSEEVRDGMVPRKRPDGPKLDVLREGETLVTKAGQRRLVQLADGTRLFVNEKSRVEATGPRQITLHAGQIYLEVAPLEDGPSFSVKSGNREMTATGTHFGVQAHEAAAGVVVTQGKVAVKGIAGEVTAGQRIETGASQISIAPRASHTLEWTRELMAAAETPMVPGAEHAGGALLALDPNGQEIKLSLRKYHIDVHIEDGFARTTIDQTYFNTTWERLEGTFYFPLPADASLSRLAMYVADANNQCRLMEGGMAERKHAADVYETIRYQRRDPALLEWLDGTTFKMRVFPLEARQEKRIILSYTQKLPSLYGIARYRFPGGHNMPMVREWSFSARVKNGSTYALWSPSHADMNWLPDLGDMVGTLHDGPVMRLFFPQIVSSGFKQARNDDVMQNEDVLLEVQDRNALADLDVPRFASFVHENQTYLMLRYRPTLPSLPQRQRRDWVVLFEASAQRDPLLAGTQVDILRQLLRNAEYDDTFTLITANTNALVYNDRPLPARPAQVENALKFLYESTHLVGALDLEQGLRSAEKIARELKNPHLLHIGSGIPALGERDAGKLAELLPRTVRYVGVGVGKRWNRAFMKTAAERTGGLFTQINPDEVISWRAFDLLATLNTPRLLDVQVVDGNQNVRFLAETTMIAQGEEICAITRVEGNKQPIPGRVIVKGMLDGKPTVREFQVINVAPGAGYLPRTWAKLEIDRLLADGAEKNRGEITALSKAMYVMSPFTSLLVLETDADYATYKVDRGRKDHWAMYACPAKVPVVYEADGRMPVKDPEKKVGQKPSCDNVLETIVWRTHDVRPSGPDTFDYSVPPVEFSGPLSHPRYENDGSFIGSEFLYWKTNARLPTGTLPPVVLPFDSARYDAKWITELTTNEDKIEREKRERKEPPGLTPWRTNPFFRSFDVGIKKDPSPEKDRQRLWYELSDLKEQELIDAENLKAMGEGWRRFWTNDQPTVLKPYPVHGGVGPAASAFDDDWGVVRLDLPGVQSLFRRQSEEFFERISRNGVGNSRKGLGLSEPLAAPSRDMGDGAKRLPANVKALPDLGVLVLRAKNPQDLQAVNDAINQIQGKPVPKRGGVGGPGGFAPGSGGFGSGGIAPGGGLGGGGFRSGPPFGGGGFGRSFRSSLSFNPSPGSLQYQRPQIDYDRSFFTDLVQYAPGLHAFDADILATLEAEAEVAQPRLGKIDADARKLIDKARSADWSALSVAEAGALPGYKVFFNGAGQFTYERILVSGLREQVICDGKTLWHLYPEIGLASKRAFSRHHESLILPIAPTFIPSAEGLARGHDVKAIDANTIALIPFGADQIKDGKYHRLHLIFAASGQLSERRIVEIPSGKVLFRQVLMSDGAVEWRDAGDKVLAKQTRTISPAQAPNLQPDVRDLVVVTMPVRTREHVIAEAKKRGLDHEKDPDIVAQCVIANCFTGQTGFNRPMPSFDKVVHATGERRLGYLTLINAAGFHIDRRKSSASEGKAREIDIDWAIDIEKEFPNSALARFLTEGQREIQGTVLTLPRGYDDEAWQRLKNAPGPKDGFIQKLARFHAAWSIWRHQAPLHDKSKLPIAKAEVLAFLQETTSPVFAYTILDTMQRRCEIPPTDRMMELAVKRFGPLSDPLGLGYLFRYEFARSLWQAGNGLEAALEFKTLHADTLAYGVLPPIDAAFREVLQMPVGDGPRFIPFTRKTLDEFLRQKRYGLAFQLAKQTEKLGDEALCDDILATILAKAPAEERNLLTFVSTHIQVGRNNLMQADRLVQKLLQDQKLAGRADLWYWRSQLAQKTGQTAVAVGCMEKALELEYADLPEVIDLEALRKDYRWLLGQYQSMAGALASLGKEAPTAFLAKVIRTADRWRLLDGDSAEPCQLAGKIFHTLGKNDLAWAYWTTPVDLHPNESKPWLDLAETMSAEGDLERADRALALAFIAEGTNPEILWKRAHNLVRMGHGDEARLLYRQIAAGKWQERFNGTVEQARGLAGQ